MCAPPPRHETTRISRAAKIREADVDPRAGRSTYKKGGEVPATEET
jgi:hypothetical protein